VTPGGSTGVVAAAAAVDYTLGAGAGTGGTGRAEAGTVGGLLVVVVGGKGATLGSGEGRSVEVSGANPGGIVGVAMVVAAKMLASCLRAMVYLMLTQGSEDGDGEEG
jgi:hypothetical protein